MDSIRKIASSADVSVVNMAPPQLALETLCLLAKSQAKWNEDDLDHEQLAKRLHGMLRSEISVNNQVSKEVRVNAQVDRFLTWKGSR